MCKSGGATTTAAPYSNDRVNDPTVGKSTSEQTTLSNGMIGNAVVALTTFGNAHIDCNNRVLGTWSKRIYKTMAHT